ncbi:MAG: ribosome recycling factor [Desulfurella sp.]|jgi:ribosome recycling factor|uniref:Ribosome-recycling factor n=1 Tax=Desulfurella multipotens TaxID=79269 RepID=A0A1G6K1S1_9BACT|nr:MULTISPECIES: ribosome recycling factor [Desulfurella]AHF97124.1 ribosome recycling factor [Desulfurella acetivorans A63]HEX13257.1 ribosome recycling factor [Desulfurella acetivorans]PMP67597.1 MAG: ribosome recycling factor [Desulfurella multipotens]PMP88150.1 MAG: ribosome recycling factor [Desulfurella sp.]SDC24838.1 ribosome recycling factor [Desulfurella multipotens]
MIDEVKPIASEMEKALLAYKNYVTSLKTGKAHSLLVENILIESYEKKMPLKQVASISVPDATTIIIKPWDLSLLKAIEKAILKSNIGLTPNNDGKVVKINMPPLTEEDRKSIVKQLKQESEKYKVNIRNIRKKANTILKDLEKDKAISKDDLKKEEDEMQKLTDKYIKEIDNLFSLKEKEILSV